MNTVKVYVKQNGVYTEVTGAIAELTGGEMLDSQLDEARLIITNSPVENYPPLTEFRIDFLRENTVYKRIYMVSGEPKAQAYVKPTSE